MYGSCDKKWVLSYQRISWKRIELMIKFMHWELSIQWARTSLFSIGFCKKWNLLFVSQRMPFSSNYAWSVLPYQCLYVPIRAMHKTGFVLAFGARKRIIDFHTWFIQISLFPDYNLFLIAGSRDAFLVYLWAEYTIHLTKKIFSWPNLALEVSMIWKWVHGCKN